MRFSDASITILIKTNMTDTPSRTFCPYAFLAEEPRADFETLPGPEFRLFDVTVDNFRMLAESLVKVARATAGNPDEEEVRKTPYAPLAAVHVAHQNEALDEVETLHEYS